MKIVKNGRLVDLDRQLTQAEYDQAIVDTANAGINPAAMSQFYDGTRPSDVTKQQVGLLAQAAVAKAAKHAEERAVIDRANRIAAADAGNVALRPAPRSGSEYQQRALELRDLVAQVYGGDRELRVLHDQNGYPFPALAICHVFSGHPEYAGSVDVLERRVDLDRRELDMRRHEQQAAEEYAAQRSRELHEAQTAAYENPVTAQLRTDNAALRDELDQLRSLVLAGHAPEQESAVISVPADESTPEPEHPAIVVDETGDESGLIASLKRAQAEVIDRLRSR
jgi:hypothetical protein